MGTLCCIRTAAQSNENFPISCESRFDVQDSLNLDASDYDFQVPDCHRQIVITGWDIFDSEVSEHVDSPYGYGKPALAEGYADTYVLAPRHVSETTVSCIWSRHLF